MKMVGNLNFETKNLSDLKPAEYNPRKRLTPDDEEYHNLKKSIETFGCVEPIVINKDGTIIGGHQRYFLLCDMGITETQVSVVDLPKDEEKTLNIALNKITGEWDMDKLKDVIGEINLSELDATITGFNDEEIKTLIGEVNIDEIENDVQTRNIATKICKCPQCGYEFETL